MLNESGKHKIHINYRKNGMTNSTHLNSKSVVYEKDTLSILMRIGMTTANENIKIVTN